MEYWTILLSIVIGVLSYYLFRNFNFFKRHGIIHVPPIPILGSSSPVIFCRTSTTDFLKKLYNLMPDARYFEFYFLTQPIFFLRDPELIKDIFVKNFEAFPNCRRFGDDSLFDKSLFSLQGQRWKNVRTLLTSAFTSSKMKIMFSLMSECAVDFTTFLSAVSSEGSDIDMTDAFTKYTNDIIATCAFGIKVDTMRNPTNTFYIYGKDTISLAGTHMLKFLFFRAFPWLSRNLDIKIVSDHFSNFFKNIIKTAVDIRDGQSIVRPDMIQLMMDIRDKREAEEEFSIDDIVAQAFLFYVADFAINSTVMSFAAHVIATHPDIQAKLRQEIDDVLQETNGEVTYEAINKLKYLDAVVNEVLRLYPPVIFIERVCEKAYELPPALPNEKSFTLKKGMIGLQFLQFIVIKNTTIIRKNFVRKGF